MGVSNSWFAVRGWSREEALAELGFQVVKQIGDNWPRGPAVSDLPDGWLLFVGKDLKQALGPDFIALSSRGPAVACVVEEHVMFQEARGYANGAETWRVTHDCEREEGVYHLEIDGQPPEELARFHREAIAAQDAEGGEDAEVDLISDVPLNLAKSICGFKHDEEWPDVVDFAELRTAGSADAGGAPKPGFLARLFGGR